MRLVMKSTVLGVRPGVYLSCMLSIHPDLLGSFCNSNGQFTIGADSLVLL